MSSLAPASVAAPDPAHAAWRWFLGAVSLTGAASVAGAALSLAATKIFAAATGPAGIAVLGTLQQVRQAALTAATLNGQTALVQGLSARSESNAAQREFLRTATLLVGAATLLTACVLLFAPGWVAEFAGIGQERAAPIRWLAVSVVLTGALVVRSAMLNANRKFGRLALVQAAAPAALALLAYPAARATRPGNETALGWWLAAAPAFALCLAGARPGIGPLQRRYADRGRCWNGAWWNGDDVRAFLKISGSMLAGGVAGPLAVLTARARILDQQGFAAAGEFDAAWAISMNQASLLLGSLQSYCLPELARASDTEARAAQLRRMLTAATVAATAAICALAIFKPAIVTLLYSGAFRGAVRSLRWTLLGDYLRVTSAVLSISMLAAADMRAFLGADLAAYAVFAAAAAALARFRGAAEATAIGYAMMYAAHLAVCGWIAARRYGFRPDARLATVWSAGLAAVLTVSALTWNET